MERRKSYEVRFKLKVIKYAELHGNRAAARHFGPPPSEKSIRLWRNEKNVLLQTNKGKRARRTGKPMWPELETDLAQWIDNHRSSGISISTKMIIIQAQQLATERGIHNFKGTSSWCERFMKRKGLSMRVKTKLAQKLPKEYEEKILSFHRFIIRTREQEKFQLRQIFNMDETPLTFDVPSNRTVAKKGDKTIMIKTSGHEKNHFTVVLGCSADGSKLLPMIIFKRKTMPKDRIPAGVVVSVQEKGWMNEDGMNLWIDKVWERRKGALLKNKALLVYDQFRAHLLESIKERFQNSKTSLGVIPGGLTSHLQPLDVSINRPFKQYMREEWNNWMINTEAHQFTPKGALKRPTITQVCEWVKRSWARVSEEIIKKSFLKCGISNAMDGTEDELVYKEDGDSSSGESDASYEESSSDDEQSSVDEEGDLL